MEEGIHNWADEKVMSKVPEGTDLGLICAISLKVLQDYVPLRCTPTSWNIMNEVLSGPQNMDMCDLNDTE